MHRPLAKPGAVLRGILTVACTALPLSAPAAPADIAPALETIRADCGVPALAAAAVIGGELIAQGASGVRSSDGTDAVTVDDLWHVGSCTKSMTSTLAAMMVDKGEIHWESTVGDVLSEIPMHEHWRQATLIDLLSHRAGAPAVPPPTLWQEAWRQSGTHTRQRTAFVAGLLHDPPDTPQRTFTYSNQGYAIAGSMLEKAAGQPWEDLLSTRLFQPLGLSSAGFGPPCSPERPRQPLGHRWIRGTPHPVPPGPQADNPPAIAPAGAVHLSIGDFARYAGFHAREGAAGFLPEKTLQKLHTPSAGDYALGWRVTQRQWAGGRALTHAGSNTMFFAVMWVAPERGFAAVAATNIAGPAAESACDQALSLLIRQHLTIAPAGRAAPAQ